MNTLNELAMETNYGRLTVAGTTTSPATNVTVNTSNAVLYADTAFASTNQPWVNGNNTFTAIAKDSYGRIDTNSITVNLQLTNSYTYDLNGNLLYDGNRAFVYDDENQLLRVTVTNQWKTEYVYDGKLRRRITKDYTWNGSSWLQTNEVHYVYDGNLAVQERDANNLPQVTYMRGTDLSGTLQGAGGIGGLLARTVNSSTLISQPSTSFYHADGNGNITLLISSSQMIVAKYLYDPFGNTLAQSGLLADANAYRFSSKEWNANAGLYYYLYRFYDPNLQRWPNRDPLFSEIKLQFPIGVFLTQTRPIVSGEISNPYRFCLNSPMEKIDIDGLNPISILLGGLALGNCGIALYDLDQYLKCMGRVSDANNWARTHLDVEASCFYIKNNTGSECNALLNDAASRGLKCGLWGAVRSLLLKAGINPMGGGKL